MATLFEMLDGVRAEEDSLKGIPFSEWTELWHEQARPMPRMAFSHMPPIVAMETWFNSLEFDEMTRQSDE